MVKFPEAMARMINDVFVCRRCKSKIRAKSLAVSQNLVSCRKCSSRKVRPKRKK